GRSRPVGENANQAAVSSRSRARPAVVSPEVGDRAEVGLGAADGPARRGGRGDAGQAGTEGRCCPSVPTWPGQQARMTGLVSPHGSPAPQQKAGEPWYCETPCGVYAVV